MTVYRFYALSNRTCKTLAVAPIPFPIRPEREKEIFSSRGAALDLLLDELQLYLIDHPEDALLYKEAAARLATAEGIRRGEDGFHEHASHYFELGLALAPENLALRCNLALALQAAGRLDDAIRQYRFLLNEPAVSGQFLVLIPAAKLFLDCGDPVTAHQILKHCASFMPVDHEFWELYADARERCGIARRKLPKQKKIEGKLFASSVNDTGKAAIKKNFCPACGNRLKPGARFCGGCGHAL